MTLYEHIAEGTAPRIPVIHDEREQIKFTRFGKARIIVAHHTHEETDVGK